VSDFFFDYGLFLAKTATFLLAIAAVIALTARFASRDGLRGRDKLEIKKLNTRYDNMALALKSEILTAHEFKDVMKAEKKRAKAWEKSAANGRSRVYVLDFDGDIRASAVTNLREEITAVLTVARPDDEVFVRLNSPGGLVHTYGLAASQLTRIRKRGVPLTVAVDKVAASGGYMMACVANRIIAAPFAVLGSIGVLAQVPNFNRLLKKNHIDYEQFTAGEFKRTVTMFGENTDMARAKFREEIEQTHQLFKDFVTEHRPAVDIAKVSTGEHWHGIQALDLKLVDELLTSDDYLLQRSAEADVFEVNYRAHKPWSARFGSFLTDAMGRVRTGWGERTQRDRPY
jgi:serine protease SohB